MTMMIEQPVATITDDELRTMRIPRHGDVNWWPGDELTVARARRAFDTFKGHGFAAYTVDPETKEAEVIREFDPEADEIVMFGPLQGG